MRCKGTIVEWQDDRGFGFIEPQGGGERVFCHVKAFAIRLRRPIPGDGVTYATTKDRQGRPQATQVRPSGLDDASYNANVGSRRQPKQYPTRSTARTEASSASATTAYVGVALFFVAITVLTAIGRVPFFLPLAYLIMSSITIFAYAFDKSAAMNRRWRTQEQTLHALELLGGWPGAWIAQHVFRHKSRKASFQVVFWLCVIANVVGVVLYSGLVEWRKLL